MCVVWCFVCGVCTAYAWRVACGLCVVVCMRAEISHGPKGDTLFKNPTHSTNTDRNLTWTKKGCKACMILIFTTSPNNFITIDMKSSCSSGSVHHFFHGMLFSKVLSLTPQKCELASHKKIAPQTLANTGGVGPEWAFVGTCSRP